MKLSFALCLRGGGCDIIRDCLVVDVCGGDRLPVKTSFEIGVHWMIVPVVLMLAASVDTSPLPGSEQHQQSGVAPLFKQHASCRPFPLQFIGREFGDITQMHAYHKYVSNSIIFSGWLHCTAPSPPCPSLHLIATLFCGTWSVDLMNSNSRTNRLTICWFGIQFVKLVEVG